MRPRGGPRQYLWARSVAVWKSWSRIALQSLCALVNHPPVAGGMLGGLADADATGGACSGGAGPTKTGKALAALASPLSQDAARLGGGWAAARAWLWLSGAPNPESFGPWLKASAPESFGHWLEASAPQLPAATATRVAAWAAARCRRSAPDPPARPCTQTPSPAAPGRRRSARPLLSCRR